MNEPELIRIEGPVVAADLKAYLAMLSLAETVRPERVLGDGQMIYRRGGQTMRADRERWDGTTAMMRYRLTEGDRTHRLCGFPIDDSIDPRISAMHDLKKAADLIRRASSRREHRDPARRLDRIMACLQYAALEIGLERASLVASLPTRWGSEGGRPATAIVIEEGWEPGDAWPMTPTHRDPGRFRTLPDEVIATAGGNLPHGVTIRTKRDETETVVIFMPTAVLQAQEEDPIDLLRRCADSGYGAGELGGMLRPIED